MSDEVKQPILMPGSRDALILAALNQIAADIRAIRIILEHEGYGPPTQ